MTAAAVNCLLTEAIWNRVSAEHALLEDASASPDDARCRLTPSRVTKREPENLVVGRTPPSYEAQITRPGRDGRGADSPRPADMIPIESPLSALAGADLLHSGTGGVTIR